MSDRTVHAASPGRATVLVRYDRAGHWYVEDLTGPFRSKVTLAIAAETALAYEREGGRVFEGKPGGTAFDARVRRLRQDGAA